MTIIILAVHHLYFFCLYFQLLRDTLIVDNFIGLTVMTCSYLWPESTGDFGQMYCVAITAVTMLISIPGNALTGLIIVRSETLRSEPAYLLICSVCLADTLVSTVAQPLYITTLLIKTRRSCLIDHAFFTFAWISSVASTLGIINITVDRYVYIVHPLQYPTYITKTRARLMMVAVWSVAVLYGIIPNFYYKPMGLHSTTLIILILISIFMGYTYRKVYKKVTNASNPPLPGDYSKHQKLKAKSQNQATRTVLLVVLAFFGCWFPWTVTTFLISLFKHVKSLKSFTNDSIIMKLHWIFLGIGYSNSALNVFIYSRKNTVLRLTIQKFLGFKSCSDQSSPKQIPKSLGCCLISLINQKLKNRRDIKRRTKSFVDKFETPVIASPLDIIPADNQGNLEAVATIHNGSLAMISNNNNIDKYLDEPTVSLNLRSNSWCGNETKQTSFDIKRHRTETQLSILSV